MTNKEGNKPTEKAAETVTNSIRNRISKQNNKCRSCFAWSIPN